jgi:transposase-like protein
LSPCRLSLSRLAGAEQSARQWSSGWWPWRQFHCTSCDGFFPEHHGTIFHGKQAEVELIVHVLACLAEGLGIRATARVFEVAPNTQLFSLFNSAT